MKEIKRYFVVPKTKITHIELQTSACGNDYRKYIELLEEFEINELTEKNIKEKINEYNFENEKNIFNKYKINDFILVKIEEFSEGKIIARQARYLELSKK